MGKREMEGKGKEGDRGKGERTGIRLKEGSARSVSWKEKESETEGKTEKKEVLRRKSAGKKEG